MVREGWFCNLGPREESRPEDKCQLRERETMPKMVQARSTDGRRAGGENVPRIR